MAHLNEYLQPCPGYGWQGGPTFSTNIVTLNNGHERRNANWKTARHRYTAPFQNISMEAYTNIKRMHLVCRGMLHAFRFRDELDYQASNEPLGVGDGVETAFDLVKVSAIQGVVYTRRITAVASVDSITIDGVEQAEGLDYTVDMERGIVTFSTAPAAGAIVAWSGTFDVWVRFDTDDLPFTIDNPGRASGSVLLIEVKPPILPDP